MTRFSTKGARRKGSDLQERPREKGKIAKQEEAACKRIAL